MENEHAENKLINKNPIYLNENKEIQGIIRENTQRSHILKGLIVVELEGYLPLSFMGKMLKDLGAEVIIIKQYREKEDISLVEFISHLEDGKKPIYLNLKNERDLNLLKIILEGSDILIEGYRPGVLEKMNLNPKDLLIINPKLIVVRMTGFGQKGVMAKQPGHEINYLSLSGALDSFKSDDNKILNPKLILGDLFCGSLMPIYHISQALLNRKINKVGCIIDTAITTNLMSMNLMANKFVDKDNFYFTCVTKNYEYLLFSYKNEEKLNFYLKHICERLIIEAINLSDISEQTRENLTRNYIDFFELMTKNVSESMKFIKDLCKRFTNKEISKYLEKCQNVKIIPILQHRDLFKFYEDNKLIKDENIKNPFKISISNKEHAQYMDTNCDFKKDSSNSVLELLRVMKLNEEDIEYIDKQNLKAFMKPKL